MLIFRPDGSILKELEFSAFGQVMLDSNPAMRIPIGFQGGIVLPHGSFVYTRSGRIYHPLIVQYLNPDWERVQGVIKSPLDLFVYRFANNDPINRKQEDLEYMTDVEQWIRMFGIDVDKILDASRRNLDAINGLGPLGHKIAVNSDHLTSQMELVSGLDNTLKSAERGVAEISFVRAFTDFERVLSLNSRISSMPIAFGAGFLLSVAPENNLAVVNVIEGTAPGVVQKIFESVVNGSRYLDVSFHQSAGKSVYYFAKPSVSKFRIDMDAVNRLAGEFEVAVRELDKGDKDLKIENDVLVAHVIYGGSASHHREAIQAEQLSQASNLAWAREKALVSTGFKGQGDWTKSQRAELVSGRKVKTFSAVEIHPRNRYPDLVRDASNYFFADSGPGGHRRKSRHGKARRVGGGH